MAMNKYMHPRNIYKTPPNFKQLAIEFPEFREHVSTDLKGKVTINFKDVNALRALSRTLLKKDFHLDVIIPPNKLIPTIPLRLNYLLWIEDLLSIASCSEKIKGIDIGTGAACVYPLMAAKKYNWYMLATEISDDSIQFANENVTRNGLSHFIEVRKVKEDSLLMEVVGDSDEFDFCMCNPPFFSSTQELHPPFKARNLNRPRPRNAFCANVSEVVSQGGEVDFITKMIEESKTLDEKIKIYTTMIGHKSSIVPLKRLLRQLDIVSFKQTEFCQGHTTRWGLAWTFCDIDLRKVPEATVAAARKEKSKAPLHYDLTLGDKPVTVDEICQKIVDIFKTLSITYEEIKHSKNLIGFNIKAASNTWSHQRRKRREQARRLSTLDQPMEESSKIEVEMNPSERNNNGLTKDNRKGFEKIQSEDFDNAVNLLADLDVGPTKRAYEEEDEATEYYLKKKVKTGTGSESKMFLEAIICLRHENDKYTIEMSYVDGTGGKDVLHQIMQYFKNNLKV